MTLEEMKNQWPEISIGHSTDYTNQKFGKLTCLYRTNSNSSGTVWVCRCECGNIKPIAISHIKKRKNPTCGCGNTLDITGKRFGKLIALHKVASRNNKTFWLCQCDCGKQKEIQTGHLTSGATTSCGECFGSNPIQNIYKNNISSLEKVKVCEICGKEFYPDEFGFSRKYCYNCVPSTKDYTSSQIITIKRRAIKHALIEYKGGKCCRCGYDKCDRALEFHHINPNEKDFSISRSMDKGINKLKEEVDKCILVCSNCHAEIHEELDKEIAKCIY